MPNIREKSSIGTFYFLSQGDIDAYLGDVESKNRKTGTLENYRRSLQAFFSWLPEGKRVDRQRVEEYQRYLAGRYAPGTANMKMTPVNGLLDFLNLRECQVTEKIQGDRRGAKPELTRSEYLRMLSAAKGNGDERLYLLIKLFASTGIAVQEVEGVTVEAVRGGAQEGVRFPACLRQELLAFAGENGVRSGPIFLTKQGKPLGRTTLSNMVPRIAKDARVEEGKCTPRCLRRLYAETWRSIQANVAQMLQMTYDKLLEQEQALYGWEDPPKQG